MIGRIGVGQLLIVFGIFVVLFGYKKIPELGRGLGKGIREMRKAVHEPDEIDVTQHSAYDEIASARNREDQP